MKKTDNKQKEARIGPFKNNKRVFLCLPLKITWGQCDQTGRFIGLWATFKSLWQQLIWPNLQHFCKDVKIYHFSSEIIFRQLL